MDSDKKKDPNPTEANTKAVVPAQEEKKEDLCDIENQQKVEFIGNLAIPEKEKLKLLSLVFTSSSYEGPLPPSKQFKGYEDTIPGAGDRIIKMAEAINDASVRRMDARTKVHIRQNTFGFILAFGILGITVFALIQGMKEGLWLVLAELVTMLSIFLGNKLIKK